MNNFSRVIVVVAFSAVASNLSAQVFAPVVSAPIDQRVAAIEQYIVLMSGAPTSAPSMPTAAPVAQQMAAAAPSMPAMPALPAVVQQAPVSSPVSPMMPAAMPAAAPMMPAAVPMAAAPAAPAQAQPML